VKGFRDNTALAEFCLLCAAAFLAFFTLSLSAVLAVVMKSHGIPLNKIGLVLSVAPSAVVVSSLMAGKLAASIGNLGTLRLGVGMLLLSNLSFHFTLDYLPAATLSSLVQGAGVGIFMAPAMAFARSKLTQERVVYLFGIYSSMISLPYAFGPPAAEAYLKVLGDDWFFVVGAVPAALSLMLSFALTKDHPPQGDAVAKVSLLATALLPSMQRPLVAVLIVGALYGLIPSYMAPIISDKNVSIGYFFTTFTVVVFTSRFALMGFLEALPRKQVLLSSVLAMALSYAVLGAVNDPISVVITGVLFGFGFSISYPMLSIWVTEQFAASQRTTPLAVFNAACSLGIVAAPSLGTYVIAALGGNGLLWALSALMFALVPYLAFANVPPRGLPIVAEATPVATSKS
jgi:MFS family permease